MPKSLWNRGFIALLITQFMVSFNDNVFRWLIIPIGKYCEGWNTESGQALILSLGAITFLLPFVLFTPYAGFCTDRFSRRSVMIWCKVAEIVFLIGGIFAILAQSVPGMLTILCLLGVQGAFFSPSKYGSLPDLVPPEKLSAANGVIAMTTMIAVVGGQVLGGLLFTLTTAFGNDGNPLTLNSSGLENSWIWIVSLLGVATLGWISSLFVTPLAVADPKAKFPLNPATQICKDIYTLAKLRWIFIPALGSAFFWGVGALSQTNIDLYAQWILRISQVEAMYLIAILSFGIAAGSIMAGVISKHRIELGLVPIGALGITVCGFLLAFTPEINEAGRTAGMGTFSFIYGSICLFLLGTFAGLYDIPMVSYIQQQSPPEKRGRILAATNFFSFSAMLFFAGGVFLFFSNGLGLNANQIWCAMSLLVLLVTVLLTIHFRVPFMIFFFRTLCQIIYRPKYIGMENVPAKGAVMLICNHISLLDGFFLYFACPRNIRFVAFAGTVPRIFECVARETGLIKIVPGSPKSVIAAVRAAREALQNGDIIGVCPEGGITRNGQMKGFEPGFMAMLKGVTGPEGKPIPVIPCYIDGLHESMFGYKYGDQKVILRPRKLLSDVLVSFGKPMYDVKYPQQVQLAVQELGVDSRREHNKKLLPIPIRQLIRTCKKHGRQMMFADSTGIEASGYKFLTATLALRSHLKKSILRSRQEEPHVGLLAPMSVGGCMLNAAVNLDRRVPVNLNFTFGADGINYCIRQAGIKTVLTSRRVLERFPDMMKQLEANVICTEDLIKQLKPLSKITNLLVSIAVPKWLIEWKLGLRARNLGEELLAIIYTSGSTGQPKGVMLTNDNIAAVGYGFVGTQRLTEKDTLLGFLPFFHSFGLMGNFWLSILSGAKGVFHFSPLEPKKIGEMARKYAVNFMPSTPTFLRNFLRHCPKEDFENVSAIICGAEKMPVDLIEAWKEKYGVRPTEGYGTTELSPVMATNVPASRVSDNFHTYQKDGSIGRPIVGIAVKVIDLDTGADLQPNEVGMIVAKGPTVMKGYYKQPDKTAEVLKDGWYTTGDVGKIDEDGFIWVTGRQTRISKIGGEMVPHILIEEEVTKILSENKSVDSESNEPIVAVTALPHPTRGEQIIVLYRDSPLSPVELIERMVTLGLPRIWIPHVEGFVKVDSIPLLGTGKLDLAAVKRTAQELFDK